MTIEDQFAACLSPSGTFRRWGSEQDRQLAPKEIPFLSSLPWATMLTAIGDMQVTRLDGTSLV